MTKFSLCTSVDQRRNCKKDFWVLFWRYLFILYFLNFKICESESYILICLLFIPKISLKMSFSKAKLKRFNEIAGNYSIEIWIQIMVRYWYVAKNDPKLEIMRVRLRAHGDIRNGTMKRTLIMLYMRAKWNSLTGTRTGEGCSSLKSATMSTMASLEFFKICTRAS